MDEFDGPISLALNVKTLLERAEARMLPVTMTPIAGSPVTWKASLGTTYTAALADKAAAVAELERITR